MTHAPLFNLGVSGFSILPQQSNFPSAIDGQPKYPLVANIKNLPFVLVSNNINDAPDYTDLQIALNTVGSGIFYVRNTGTPYTFTRWENTADNQIVVFEAGTQINPNGSAPNGLNIVVGYTSNNTPLYNNYWYGNGAIITLPDGVNTIAIAVMPPSNSANSGPSTGAYNIVVDGFVMNGNGSATNILKVTNLQNPTVATPYTATIRNLTVNNIYIYGNRFSSVNIEGSTSDSTFSNMIIDNSNVPPTNDYSALIMHSGDGSVSRLTFRNVQVKGNGTSGQVLEIQGSVVANSVTVTSHIRFIDCVFDTGAPVTVSAGTGGPYIDDNNGTSNSAYVTNIDFINCQWINAVITYQSTATHFGYIRFTGSQPQGFSGTLSGRSIGSNNTGITVGTSPFTYTNSYDFPVIVTVNGGTVTGIALDGITTGATAGAFLLLPNHTLQVTYTTAPTMTAISI